jgi:hypothetical protein
MSTLPTIYITKARDPRKSHHAIQNDTGIQVR